MRIIITPQIEKIGEKIAAVKEIDIIIDNLKIEAAIGVLTQALLKISRIYVQNHPPECKNCVPLAMSKATIRAIAEIQREMLERHGMNPEEYGWPDPNKKINQGEKNNDRSADSGPNENLHPGPNSVPGEPRL